MENRANKFLEQAVKLGVYMAKNKDYNSARRMMLKAGVNSLTIVRVLYAPHSLRKTDNVNFAFP